MKRVIVFTLTILFIASCASPVATATQAPPSTESPTTAQPIETTPHTTTPTKVTLPSYPIRIKVSTTSDWTSVHLTGGGSLNDIKVTSSSAETLTAGLEGESIVLSQALDRAEGDKSVELVVEALLTDLEPASSLTFEIERGHIGTTQVEISRYSTNTPSVVASLTWDGIKPSGNNAQTYQVSTQLFLDAALNEYIVIAQLNFWFGGPGPYGGFENADGSRMTPLTPLLGETYWAKDPSVVYQQIEWAVEYGVDAFSIEWTTPRGVGCCGSMEDVLDDVFLKSPNIHKVRFAIFYDFPLRLMQTEELDVDMKSGINFNQPDVYNTFVYDLVRFAKMYFGNPQYLTIDDRPVFYVWATHSFKGNLAGAMQEARNRVSELGYDVFIVGDEVCYQCFNRQHASLFDANSTFTFLIPGLDGYAMDNVGEAAVQVDRAFQWWREQIAGLKVAGREELVNFQPAWAPQYDERGFITNRPLYVPAESKDQVIEMAMVARKHAEPAGSHGQKLIWINTWNCWGETTTIEPTANLGPKYPAGNYQFDMLEVVREVFGSETFYTQPVK